MHELKIDTIVKSYTSLVMRFRNACLLLCGNQLISEDKIFVNIEEGFALIYYLYLQKKDILAEEFLHKS